MLIGHQKQWEFLRKSAELGRFSHAYLFTGPEKVGKKTVAIEWISLLFAQSSINLDNRGSATNFREEFQLTSQNGALLRSSLSLVGNHPDFILITPLQKEIQISQIKDLNYRLSLRPYSAPFKAVIIDQAHAMNGEAQNCFLKTLEEPRGETLLILITEYPEFLFPTIRSRSEIFKFYPVAKKEIENYLKTQGVKEKKAQLISQISQGRPGVAIDFLKRPKKLKEREVILKEIIRLAGTDLIFRFQYAKKISRNSDLQEILKIWLACFRENLISYLNSKAEPEKTRKLAKILEKIQETFFLISTTNVNPRLALENLMMEL